MVVIISIARHRSSLALGNIVGSAISNILGAFSLGLLFHSNDARLDFDNSSKLYSAIQLVITALVSGILAFAHRIWWEVLGGVFIGVFAVYIATISWTIIKGLLVAPEGSDDDSESDDSSSEEDTERNAPNDQVPDTLTSQQLRRRQPATQDAGVVSIPLGDYQPSAQTPTQQVPTQPDTSDPPPRRRRHSLQYHLALLAAGFIAVVLSSYVRSTAATNLVDEFHISDTLFGVVILSIATTLPEKFIAVMSSHRGHAGILVANTVGSNIFLLTLVIGILWVTTGGIYNDGSVEVVEIAVMLGSSVIMMALVWLGVKWPKLIGGFMLAGYIVFVVVEFAVVRNV